MIQQAWQINAEQARTQMRANLAARKVMVKDPKVPQRFGHIAEGMWQGYHAAIADEQPEAIVAKLNAIDSELLGFALEGVGIALTELNALKPQNQNRVEAFLEKTTAAYQTMVYLGVGLGLVRYKLPIELHLNAQNPVTSWPVIDGYAFNHGVYYWQDYIDGQALPVQLSGYACRVFDQGLGRSIWLVDCADVNRIAKTISAFPTTRQADLWGGIGYACASIGGAERSTLEALGEVADDYVFELAKGASCAAKFRQLLGNEPGYTGLASEVLSSIAARAGIEIKDIPVESLSNNKTWQHYREYLLE
ncbi:MAG: DUF1702 family protein [Nostoc sp. ChiSLP02]|nr:DUF1702 family protein [Nostoc sp. DedSLP05]MDZ8103952.1 DUF1702 family protein [Nostoc sp. DedSLP01]MDZ8187172.1 DUF1702 family protein [Nostoc sp. ChiSLP02]